MPTAGWWSGDFDLPLSGAFSCLGDVLSQVHRAVGSMSAVHGPGMRGGPWDRGSARRARPRQWGGFGGASSAWWPGSPGAPGPSRGPKAGRGDVRAAILAVLVDGPRNGYQIMSEIEERSGGAWRPSPGAVYPALSLLADEGLSAWTAREVWISGSPAPNHYVDITEVFSRKVAALHAHASQTGHMDDLEGMLRAWLSRAAAAAGLPEGRLAEAFQVLDTG